MKRTGWTFTAALVLASLGTPALARAPQRGTAVRGTAHASHLPRLRKSMRQVPAKPAVTAPKR